MRKVLLLNSGGFDSTILAHYLYNEFDFEVVSVFFDFEQRNVEQERICSKKTSEELGFKHYEIKLPKFFWTKSDFYAENFNEEKEYLEMRNMVFLSYAASIAESEECEKIYCAFLKPQGYFDTSVNFINLIQEILKIKGFEIELPFFDMEKEDIACYAFLYSLTPEDYFSCNHPIKGKPCGKCNDCKKLNILNDCISINTAGKQFAKTFNTNTPLFEKLFKETPINELRVLINNDCQLNCKHCYYGFEKMINERLSIEEFENVFMQAIDIGISNFHFSGKEPLYDDFIFDLTETLIKIKNKTKKQFTWDLVTNGINIPKYIDKIKEYGFSRVCISLDDFSNGLYRKTNIEKHIELLHQYGIPITVFIDISTQNIENILNNMKYLYKNYSVSDFYIRCLVDIGNAKTNNLERISIEKLNKLYLRLYDYLEKTKDITCIFYLNRSYTYDILSYKRFELQNELNNIFDFGTCYIFENFVIFPETYCRKYENSVTLTPDGFIHGCALEVGCKDYDKISVGNVKYNSLEKLIKLGKEKCLKDNKSYYNSCLCPHNID